MKELAMASKLPVEKKRPVYDKYGPWVLDREERALIHGGPPNDWVVYLDDCTTPLGILDQIFEAQEIEDCKSVGYLVAAIKDLLDPDENMYTPKFNLKRINVRKALKDRGVL
jgi:hypothetical protein